MAEVIEAKLLTAGAGAGFLQPPAPHSQPLQAAPQAPPQAPPQKAPIGAPAPAAPTATAAPSSPTTTPGVYVSGGAVIGIAIGSLLVGGVLGWVLKGASRE